MIFSKAEERRRAITASIFLLFSFIAVSIEQIMTGNIPFIALVLLFVSYFLARTHWYKFATLVLLVTLSFPSFLIALTRPNPEPDQILAAFVWIVLPLTLSGLIYSVQTTIIYSTINIIVLAVLPFIRSELNFGVMAPALGFYMLASLFTITVMVQRNKIENDRQKDLIDNHIKLSEEASQREKFVENAQRHADQLMTINEVGRAVAELRDLTDLLEVVYEQVKKVVSVDAFYVALYNSKNNTVSYPIMYDDGKYYPTEPEPVANQSFMHGFLQGATASLILRTKEELVLPIKSHEAIGNESKKSASLLFAPLKVREKVIGLISAQSYTMNVYSATDLKLLEGIANQVSVAIENSRLYASAQRELEERQNIEEQLRAAETRYRELVERIPAVIYSAETGDTGHWFYVSPQIKSLLGFEPEEWITNPNLWYQQIHPEDRDDTVRTEALSLEKGLSIETEYRMIAKDGRVLWIHDQSISVSTSNDKKLIVQGILTDITTRKQAELFLKESEERYHRLFVTTHRQAQELSLLSAVQNTLARELDLDALFHKVVEEIAKMFGYIFVSLYMLEDGQLHLKHQIGYEAENVLETISPTEGISGQVLNNGQAVLIKDVTNEPRFLRASPQIQSEVCVPLFDGDEICGTLNVESSSNYPLNEDDLRLMNLLAEQINIAIRRARLYTERAENLEREQHINDFAHAISSTIDNLPNALETAARVSVALTGAETGTVSIMSADGSAIVNAYSFNEHRDISRIIPKGQGLTWLAYEKRRPIIEDEYSRHPNAMPEWIATGIHAFMSIPIISAGKSLGVIAVYKRKPGRKFTPRDLSMLEAIAQETAIAIQNAQLFDALQKELMKHRETQERLVQSVKELENKNAELERFTYTVSHDLKSPIVTIAGFLGFLEEDIKKERHEKIPHTISRIREAAKKMERLLSELLELSRIGRLINPPKDIPFGELVEETLEMVHGQLTERQVEVKVEADLPVVHVDHVRMVEVLQNLIVNAIKFMGAQERPIIEIGMQEKDGNKVFFVKDNGMGVAPKFHDRIFGLFNKLDPSSDGTGIGLALVKRIIEVHGGKIWVESEVGKGATFFFTLENKDQ
ncbi:MAG: GAF domain-containing protein [Anaerolineales bacterium]|nr:GAF domain-containing protein [Anaerolineales bacterium]